MQQSLRRPPPQFYIGVREGVISNPEDDEIMLATCGSYVHVEILVQYDGETRSYGAWQGESPCFKERDPKTWIVPSQYTFFKLPIKKHKIALILLNEMLESKLEYRIGWGCMFPTTLVKLAVKDIDPQLHPSQWGQVFCSQAALLFIKQCVLMEVLPYTSILSVHSYHCSPSNLFQICKKFNFETVSMKI
jgi:hypothetical protein